MRTLLATICPLVASILTVGVASAQAGVVLPRAKDPASSAPMPERARAALARRAPVLANLAFERTKTIKLGGGRTLVRLDQTHDSIPVLSRGASVLFDSSGKPTGLVTAKTEARFPQSSQPLVDASAAAQRAELAMRGARFAGTDAELAWLPGTGDARLVWVLYRGLIPGTPRAPAVVIDASTGRPVLRFDATRFDRAASVFAENPIRTPEAVSVTLDTLALGATELANERIRARTCVDKQTLVGKMGVHFCVFEPKAIADAQGDFPYTFASDTDPEDPFAEVSMFYHSSRMYGFLEGLGMPELMIKPLTTIANLRFPMGWDTFASTIKDPSIPLEPYDNAFYTPEKPYGSLFGDAGGGLYFGQGTVADFAYDGDVVYHEFAHAMVDNTINLVPYWHIDQWGASPAPGAMNEGLADYFSSALAGDGEVGEYAAQNLGYGGGDSNIRNLDNADSCPGSIAGESHTDSTLFSGALWSVRQSLPEADRNTFDGALLTALMAAPSGDLGYDELAEVMIASVGASTLGETAAQALTTSFETRGVLPECARKLEYKGPLSSPGGKLGGAFFVPGKAFVGFDPSEAYAPGLFQAHRTIKAGAEKLRVQFENVPVPSAYQLGGDAQPFDPAVLIRFGTDPIIHTYDGGMASNAEGPTPMSGGYMASVEIDIPKDATDAWVMIVNMGDELGLMRSVSLSYTMSGGTGGTGGYGGFGGGSGGGVTVGGKGGTGGAAADDDEGGLHAAGGCQTTPLGGSTGLAALLVFVGGALGLRRRRRG